MTDIQALKSIYRRLAKIEAGDSLAEQKKYLEGRFQAIAKNVDEGDAVATAISRLGSNSNFLWRGSNAEERATALNGALADLEAEIANEGGSSLTSPAPVIVRFGGGGPFSTLDEQWP